MASSMSYRDYLTYVKSDLFRYTGTVTWQAFLRNVFLQPGFKYIFILRVCRYLHDKRAFKILFLFFKLLHRHYSFRYGISIPILTDIGYGFYIGHFGGIVIHEHSVIGHNVNISHGVTLGQANRGERVGCPAIGNQVYIGPGAKIVGKVNVGSDVAIGANCVVTKDIPEHAVAVGIPAKVISYKGSEGYVTRVWSTEKSAHREAH